MIKLVFFAVQVFVLGVPFAFSQPIPSFGTAGNEAMLRLSRFRQIPFPNDESFDRPMIESANREFSFYPKVFAFTDASKNTSYRVFFLGQNLQSPIAFESPGLEGVLWKGRWIDSRTMLLSIVFRWAVDNKLYNRDILIDVASRNCTYILEGPLPDADGANATMLEKAKQKIRTRD